MEYDQDGKIFANVIICSMRNYRKYKARYPRKKVMPDENCPDAWFYYVTRHGKIRNYDVATGMLYDLCVGDLGAVYQLTKFQVTP